MLLRRIASVVVLALLSTSNVVAQNVVASSSPALETGARSTSSSKCRPTTLSIEKRVLNSSMAVKAFVSVSTLSSDSCSESFD